MLGAGTALAELTDEEPCRERREHKPEGSSCPIGGNVLYEPCADERRGDEPKGEACSNAPVNVAESPVGGKDRHCQDADDDHRRAGGFDGGQPEDQDEERHQEEPPAVGQKSGEQADSERRSDHRRRAVASAGGPLGGTGPVGQHQSHANGKEEQAGEDDKPVAPDSIGCQRADERARHAALNGETGDTTVEVSGAEEPLSAHEGGRHHRRERGCDRQETAYAQYCKDWGGERRATSSEHAEDDANTDASQHVLDEVHSGRMYRWG